MNRFTLSRTPHTRKRRAAVRLEVELLEDRSLLSGLTLGPLVQVSGPSPFANSPVADIPTTDNSEVEPYLAADPTNPQHMVGAWIQDYARGIVAAVTFNGGATWQSVPIPGLTISSGGTYPHSSDPWLSFAPNGDLYLSALGHDFAGFGNPTAVLVSKSSDGGLTWGAPATIATDTSGEIDKPSITADPADPRFAYATWVGFSLTGNILTGTTMFSRTTDGGQTWSPARVIFDSGPGNIDQDHQIVVLPDGTLDEFFTQMVGYVDSAGIPRYDLNLSLIRSTDKGKTWKGLPGNQLIPVAESLPVSNAIYDLDSVVSPDLYLVRTPAFFFDVSVDPTSGNLYAVWQDGRFSNFQYTSIGFTMSTDGGRNWSAPIRVNQTPQDIRVGDQQAFLPSVAVAANGTVAVTYYDFRNDKPVSSRGAPVSVISTDYWLVHADAATDLTDPASWHDELRLTDKSFNMRDATASPTGYFVGDYEGLAAFGNSFGAFFSMPNHQDFDNVFFRDPPATASVGGSPVSSAGYSSLSILLSDDGLMTSTLLSSEGSWKGLAVNAYFMDLAPTSQTTSSVPKSDTAPWPTFGLVPPSLPGGPDQVVPPSGRVFGMPTSALARRDDNAAGWGWFVDQTPWDDSEFTTLGNQGEQHRMDLLTVLEHEVGHLLGREHEDGGIMAETLSPGIR